MADEKFISLFTVGTLLKAMGGYLRFEEAFTIQRGMQLAFALPMHSSNNFSYVISNSDVSFEIQSQSPSESVPHTLSNASHSEH